MNYVYLVDKYYQINEHVEFTVAETINETKLMNMAMMMSPKDRYWERTLVKDPHVGVRCVSFVVSDMFVLIASPIELCQAQIERIVNKATIKYWVTNKKRRG